MKKAKTILKCVCPYCGADMGKIDGKGVTGTTSRTCPKCAKKEWAKIGGKPPARWNLVGRFLDRRRSVQRRLEKLAEFERQADEKANERAEVDDILAKNPKLHTWIILRGKRGVHYVMAEDMAELESRVADEPEMRCKWN